MVPSLRTSQPRSGENHKQVVTWRGRLPYTSILMVAQRARSGCGLEEGVSLGPEGDQEWKGRASQDSRQLDRELGEQVAKV